MPESITSHQNPRVKQVRHLRDKASREQAGRFLIDSLREFERALASGYELDYVLVSPSVLRGELPDIPDRAIFHVPPDVLDKVAYRENPEGMVAVMKSPSVKGVSQLAKVADAPILGMVSLTKPGNIGALLRTADAAGFNTVFLIDSRLDLYNPNVIRSSTGAVFLGNIYSLSAQEARAFFQSRGFQVVGTHLHAAKDAYSVEYQLKCALLMGTEDVGLDDTWLPFCSDQVIIPMAGTLTDSLNVSVAGAVLMFEVMRQLRGGAG
ncbi:MAG: RNA methyltransferase [Anaerolineae bacterium]|nr:RNA methyltransferase [Chloroflexota bacterium]MBP6298269.1 RNA methyltransferase [Anaerolineae bacterium]